MTRVPITKDGLELLRKHTRAAIKAGNSPLSQYSDLVFVLLPDGKVIPFEAILEQSGGAHRNLRRWLRREQPWLARERQIVAGLPPANFAEPVGDDPDARGPPGSVANRHYDAMTRRTIMERARDAHDADGGTAALHGSQVQRLLAGEQLPVELVGVEALHGSQVQELLGSGRRKELNPRARHQLGGQTRFIVAKNVAPRKRP